MNTTYPTLTIGDTQYRRIHAPFTTMYGGTWQVLVMGTWLWIADIHTKFILNTTLNAQAA